MNVQIKLLRVAFDDFAKRIAHRRCPAPAAHDRSRRRSHQEPRSTRSSLDLTDPDHRVVLVVGAPCLSLFVGVAGGLAVGLIGVGVVDRMVPRGPGFAVGFESTFETSTIRRSPDAASTCDGAAAANAATAPDEFASASSVGAMVSGRGLCWLPCERLARQVAASTTASSVSATPVKGWVPGRPSGVSSASPPSPSGDTSYSA